MPSTSERNRIGWDRIALSGSGFASRASDADFRDPSRIINPFGWLDETLEDRRVLCLAAGGGKHGPLFAASGARVTVVDISGEMLKRDREVAADRGLTLDVVEGDMTDLGMLGQGVFDLVLQPVSTCYVENIDKVYHEVGRVTKPGGLYISQHKQPMSLQADACPTGKGFLLNEPYYRVGSLPEIVGFEHRERGTTEYLHRLESLLGNLCRSGFLIEDVREPMHADPASKPGSFAHRCHWIPPYLAIKARKKADANCSSAPKIWLPSR